MRWMTSMMVGTITHILPRQLIRRLFRVRVGWEEGVILSKTWSIVLNWWGRQSGRQTWSLDTLLVSNNFPPSHQPPCWRLFSRSGWHCWPWYHHSRPPTVRGRWYRKSCGARTRSSYSNLRQPLMRQFSAADFTAAQKHTKKIKIHPIKSF